ncbi:hypothetical protein IV203_027913 [Nitzschia inconspicua]|uniref:Uncharacterized protein n=1 Tax=Nitzschia inconspicua TaxID=303405 RepID=A0A9K3Q3R4_9STRA|nr:hypothetical protein IV203_027913 [Nitzschia inconspicua]
MRPSLFLVSALLINASWHNTQGRLIGNQWTHSSASIAGTNITEAAPATENNDTKLEQGPATIPILTGILFATIFDVENENSDEKCYNCCCDRDVVCNSHGKSEATCQKNDCIDGVTCESKGYTCPSYDCEVMW